MTVDAMTIEDAFAEAIREAGLPAPDEIVADGTLHRYKTTGRGPSKNGWYRLHADGVPAGAFGCWRAGISETWCAKSSSDMNPTERQAHVERIRAMQAERQAEEQAMHAKAREEAQALWNGAEPATADHPYLKRKAVQPHGLRVHGGNLLLPCYDAAGELHSLQHIAGNGAKWYVTGGRVSGCFFIIADGGYPANVAILANAATNALVISEGFATGATIHEATGLPVAVARNAGNLRHVAKALRAKHPHAHILVAADNDHATPGNPGMARATEAAQAVGGTVVVPPFPELVDGQTDFNDLMAAHGADLVRQTFAHALSAPASPTTPVAPKATASGQAWPALDPIPEPEGLTPAVFPFDALGPVLGPAAASIADDVQAPGALSGGSVLAAASLAAQPLANVVMPHGQRSPLSLFVLTSASSGDRKSAVDAVANHAIEERRRQQARDHAKAMKIHEEAKALRKKGDPEEPEPAPQSITTSNATIEGIAKLLKFQSSLGVFSSEGGEMLGGHSLRDDKRSAGMSFYLKAWGGESIDSLRGGNGLTTLLGRRLALHVLVQPILLRELLSDPLAQGQGLLARCLIAEPATLAGTRMFRPVDPNEAPAVAEYHRRIRVLLNTPPELWPDGDDYELKPRDLHLSVDARALWIAFYNQVEASQAQDGELVNARPFASKAAEHAARIAGVITVVSNPGSSQIDAEAMEGGIEIAGFYLQEHLRLTGAGRDDRHHQQLLMLVDWMRECGRTVPKKDVLQRSPRPLRKLKAEGIQPLLAELVARGYIREQGQAWEVRDVQD